MANAQELHALPPSLLPLLRVRPTWDLALRFGHRGVDVSNELVWALFRGLNMFKAFKIPKKRGLLLSKQGGQRRSSFRGVCSKLKVTKIPGFAPFGPFVCFFSVALLKDKRQFCLFCFGFKSKSKGSKVWLGLANALEYGFEPLL